MVSQGTGSTYSSDDSTRGMPGDMGRSGEKTEQVKEVADQVKTQAAQMTDQVKEQAGKVTDKAKEQATTRVDDQKARAAQGIVGFADALNQVSGSMRDQNPAVANFADTAATKLERFATTIRDKDVNELMNEVEDFARRQPALVIGGAFLAGVFAARFLKSSSGMSSGSTFQGGYSNYGNRYGRNYGDHDTRGFASQYDRPTGGSNYGSTYGSTADTTGRSDFGSPGYGTFRGSQSDHQTGGYHGGTTTGTTGSSASGQTYSPYATDESTGTTTTTDDRTRGATGSPSSS